MSLSITPLGVSAMYATAEIAASGYLLEIDEYKLWLDAGGGTWQQLLKRMDFADIDGILLTHRHPDHTVDLFQCFHARAYGGRELESIPVWANDETIGRISEFSTELNETFNVTRIEAGGVIDIGGAKASFVDMKHSAQTCGVRFEYGGAVLAYTADTGPSSDFDVLGRDADVLICEATYQASDELWEGHLSASQAGQVAAEMGPGQLVLTHLPPGRDHQISVQEAQSTAGSVPVELAEPGKTIEVGA